MDSTIQALRAFNRFHTRFIGVLGADYLDSTMSLTEARLLYEIATREAPVAVDLQQILGLDAGYASRIVRRFEQRGWVARGRSDDARRRPIELTDAGQAVFADLQQRQHDLFKDRIGSLAAADRRALEAALDTARSLLSRTEPAGYTVRTFDTGDMGLVAARQAILYRESHGWGRRWKSCSAR